MNKREKQIIIILGPPGAGKGTQASLITDKMGFLYIETSKIIEHKVMHAKEGEVEVVDGKEYELLKEKKIWEEGIICSPLLVSFWINQKIRKSADGGESIVFAGSPRTLPESEKVIPVMVKLYGKDNIKIVLLELKAEDSIYRNSNRKICELARHPILFNKETEDLTMCPLDGSKLTKREKLDDPEVIKVRLREYSERTLPIVEYLESQGFVVKKIDAASTPSIVFNNVLDAIK